MDAEFRHLDGPFEGETRVIRKDFATIGRDPSADLTLDAERDRAVSGRHAAVYRQGDGWMVRDLGGSGGTWLNESRLKADAPLAPGDVIRFGAEGPRLLFGPGPVPSAATAARIITRPPRAAAAPLPTPVPAPPPPKPAARPRLAPALAALAVVAVLGYASWARFGGGPGRPDPAPATPGAVTPAPLPAPAPAPVPLDVDAVARQAGRTVALVVAGYQDGRWPVGSGVIVQARGDTAWIVTASRLAVDPRGRPPVRIGVLLHGSTGYLRAELAAGLDASGLALLRVQTSGAAHAAAGLGAQPAETERVAVLGVLLGPDSLPAGDWRREGIRIGGGAAAVAGEWYQLEEPKALAGPGHPVFNRAGELIGLVGTQEPDSAGGRLQVIPAARLRELLGRIATRG